VTQEVEVDVSKIGLPTSSIPCQAYGIGDRFVGLNSTNSNFNVNQFHV
jgi:hypothetical protein